MDINYFTEIFSFLYSLFRKWFSPLFKAPINVFPLESPGLRVKLILCFCILFSPFFQACLSSVECFCWFLCAVLNIVSMPKHTHALIQAKNVKNEIYLQKNRRVTFDDQETLSSFKFVISTFNSCRLFSFYLFLGAGKIILIRKVTRRIILTFNFNYN